MGKGQGCLEIPIAERKHLLAWADEPCSITTEQLTCSLARPYVQILSTLTVKRTPTFLPTLADVWPILADL